MPVINIYHPKKNKNKKLFGDIVTAFSTIFGIPEKNVWIFWNIKKKTEFYKQDWDGNKNPAPVLLIQCRESYTEEKIKKVIAALTKVLIACFNCTEKEIFISFFKIKKGDLFSQGNLWI